MLDWILPEFFRLVTVWAESCCNHSLRQMLTSAQEFFFSGKDFVKWQGFSAIGF